MRFLPFLRRQPKPVEPDQEGDEGFPLESEGVFPVRSFPMEPMFVPFFNFVVYGFIYLTVIGGVLLMFPFANSNGEFTAPIDTFFTAASAVSATGLVVVSTHDHWSQSGLYIIMGLIQIGGIGFMTMSAFLLLLVGRRVNLWDNLLIESLGSTSAKQFLVFAVIVSVTTILIEVLGGLFFSLRFKDTFADYGILESAFYTISAFNNAGFDLQPRFDGISAFSGDPFILGNIAFLFLTGGLGVPMLLMLTLRRPWKNWTLDAKLAVTTTLVLLLLGAIVLGVIEVFAAFSLGEDSFLNRVGNSIFLSGAARTAGFTTVDIGSLVSPALLLLMMLMFVGGVSGSTAGGIKVNTFATVFLTAVSYLRGHQRVHAFGKVIPEVQLHRAIAVMFLGGALVLLLTIILTSIENEFDFLSVLFESVSAFSTTGLSTGITPDLSAIGKGVLIAGMLIGRVGPLTVVLALSRRTRVISESDGEEEQIRVG